MNKKIAIIGGGLFGVTTYIILKKKGFDCTLFEKKKDLLLGASTNNLNRVHFGYHYPRDDETARQSYKGYVNFRKFYKESIIENFENLYLIAEDSKVNFSDYLKFCKRNKLRFKVIDKNKLKFDTKKIEGGIKVSEPIYDWNIIRRKAKFLISTGLSLLSIITASVLPISSNVFTKLIRLGSALKLPPLMCTSLS